MDIINTEEDVFNAINYFVFNNKALDTDVKVEDVKKFISKLFDLNLRCVEPFDEITTAHLRILFYVDGWKNIFDEYLKRGINLSDSYDLFEVEAVFYDYILNPDKFKSNKTRA